jgi:uncharacterized protein (TIGR02996 family)
MPAVSNTYFSNFATHDPLEAAFLQQIRAEPDNELHRLVYADWLEERGEHKSDLIRKHAELMKRPDSESKQDYRSGLACFYNYLGQFEDLLLQFDFRQQRQCGCDFIVYGMCELSRITRDQTSPELIIDLQQRLEPELLVLALRQHLDDVWAWAMLPGMPVTPDPSRGKAVHRLLESPARNTLLRATQRPAPSTRRPSIA